MKKIVILIVLPLMLIGCMSLPVVQSSVYQESVDDEYQLYDSKSQIRYKISNDRDHLYLTLNTANKFSIMQIAFY